MSATKLIGTPMEQNIHLPHDIRDKRRKNGKKEKKQKTDYFLSNSDSYR